MSNVTISEASLLTSSDGVSAVTAFAKLEMTTEKVGGSSSSRVKSSPYIELKASSSSLWITQKRKETSSKPIF